MKFLFVLLIDLIIWALLYVLWCLVIGSWDMNVWPKGDRITYYVLCGIESLVSLYIMDYYE